MLRRHTEVKLYDKQVLIIMMYVFTIQHVQNFQHERDLPENTPSDQHPESRNYASAGKTHAFRMKGLSIMKLINRAIINKQFYLL